jgi:hypothetical protein
MAATRQAFRTTRRSGSALATKVHMIGINGAEVLNIVDTDQLVELVETRVQELILNQASIC